MLWMFATAFAANLEDHVVTLTITWQTWEPTQPWMKTPPTTRAAQGVVLRGDRILTTAAAVANANLVRVSKHGEPVEQPARVVVVDREANLALLTVDQPGFFADLRPAALDTRTRSTGEVRIARWRDNQLETAEGRIARSVVIDSATGVTDYIGLRVSTDLSGGGQGEPVFAGDKLVGLTTSQSGTDAVVTPAPFVSTWLADAADGTPPAWVGMLGVSVQQIRSPALADWLGLDAPEGLLVVSTAMGGSACGVLQRGDVLLEVDGHRLDGEGNVRDPDFGLLDWQYLLGRHRAGERLAVTVVRGGRPVALSVPLKTYTGASWLIPVDRLAPPAYLMAGGLVFREVDESFSSRTSELRILTTLWRSAQRPDRRRVVVLSSVLADPYNLGYHQFSDLWVETVNGTPVDTIGDVREAFRHPVDGFFVVGFHPNGRIAELVLDASTFDEATTRIAAAYGVTELFRPELPPPPLGEDCTTP